MTDFEWTDDHRATVANLLAPPDGDAPVEGWARLALITSDGHIRHSEIMFAGCTVPEALKSGIIEAFKQWLDKAGTRPPVPAGEV